MGCSRRRYGGGFGYRVLLSFHNDAQIWLDSEKLKM